MPEVRPERTGWRDEALSLRHRDWGWDCPAVDVDFLMVEYDKGKPLALVEYKQERSAVAHSGHPSYRAMIELGDRAGVPFFGVRYAGDFSWWRVTGLNGLAKKWVPQQTNMSEKEWVTLLYRIRGREVPAKVLEKMNDESWPSQAWYDSIPAETAWANGGKSRLPLDEADFGGQDGAGKQQTQ